MADLGIWPSVGSPEMMPWQKIGFVGARGQADVALLDS
jgi:hypothetical protein